MLVELVGCGAFVWHSLVVVIVVVVWTVVVEVDEQLENGTRHRYGGDGVEVEVGAAEEQ